jgi:hypothetical protein
VNKHNEMIREWTRRVLEVHTHWAELGHDNSAGCSGHAYPNHGCPNPELHKRLMPAGIHRAGLWRKGYLT